MPESFAGITVPDGEPGGLRDAGEAMGRAGATLDGVAQGLGALPSSLTAWQGGGSLEYGNACATSQSAVAAGADAAGEAGRLLNRYASELDDAQDAARRAIRRARDATDRKEDAERRIEAAQRARAMAAVQAASATTEMAAGAVLGTPSPGAEADLRAAQNAEAAAAEEEARARRELAQAEDDLREAKEAGAKAEEAAHQAAQAAASGLAGLGDMRPDIPMIGAPAAPIVSSAPAPDSDDGGGLLDSVQGGLDWAGFAPGVGALPDALNAGISAARGNYGEAGMSMGAAIPVWGDGVKGGKMLKEGLEAGASKSAREAAERAAREAAQRHADEVAGLTRVTGDVATDAATWRKRAARSTARLTENLRALKPTGHQTHHIIPKGAYSNRGAAAREALEESQAILQKWNIAPDDAANGVFLRRDVHAKLHTDDYFDALRDRLADANSPREAREALAEIAEELAERGRLA
jgi:hypothetical protein